MNAAFLTPIIVHSALQQGKRRREQDSTQAGAVVMDAPRSQPLQAAMQSPVQGASEAGTEDVERPSKVEERRRVALVVNRQRRITIALTVGNLVTATLYFLMLVCGHG
jgi:hypothetical protein